MNTKQSTLRSEVIVQGVGLHTGSLVEMRILPAEENHGFKFVRVDLPDQPVIPADVDYVVDLSRGTTLGLGNDRVGTVEHTLAALAGLQIDNALIEINAPEAPILDGSAQPFIEAILKAGIKEQKADRTYFEIPQNIFYNEPDRGVEMIAMPHDGFRITVMIDYNSTVLGSQHATMMDIADFKKDIAGSRTFCFLHELEYLLNNNLIKGGDLSNAIVIVDKPVSSQELAHLAGVFNKPSIEVADQGILNNIDLRFQNEPARHKLLDLIGDLALIGTPLKGQIMAARPGHAANIGFAKKIKRLMEKKNFEGAVPNYDPSVKPILDTKAIMKLLPHAYPFLLVDKILEISPKHIVGAKNVTFNEPYFQGHFPGNPLMPGVLQIEAMAQVGGVLVLNDKPDPDNYTTLFMKIESAKFKEKVVPGDTLLIKMELKGPVRRGICMMKGQIFVGDKLVTEAELMAQVVKNK